MVMTSGSDIGAGVSFSLIENVGTMRMRGKARAIERWNYGWTAWCQCSSTDVRDEGRFLTRRKR